MLWHNNNNNNSWHIPIYNLYEWYFNNELSNHIIIILSVLQRPIRKNSIGSLSGDAVYAHVFGRIFRRWIRTIRQNPSTSNQRLLSLGSFVSDRVHYERIAWTFDDHGRLHGHTVRNARVELSSHANIRLGAISRHLGIDYLPVRMCEKYDNIIICTWTKYFDAMCQWNKMLK